MRLRLRFGWVAALCAGAVGGCASSPPNPGSPGVGQVAGLGLGTAAGAVLGHQIGGETGELIGGAAGLGAAAWLENRSAARSAADAVEEARREERQKIMRQYWYDQTEAPRSPPGSGGEANLLLRYPAGAYAGLNFGPRVASDPGLAEPNR